MLNKICCDGGCKQFHWRSCNRDVTIIEVLYVSETFGPMRVNSCRPKYFVAPNGFLDSGLFWDIFQYLPCSAICALVRMTIEVSNKWAMSSWVDLIRRRNCTDLDSRCNALAAANLQVDFRHYCMQYLHICVSIDLHNLRNYLYHIITYSGRRTQGHRGGEILITTIWSLDLYFYFALLHISKLLISYHFICISQKIIIFMMIYKVFNLFFEYGSRNSYY